MKVKKVCAWCGEEMEIIDLPIKQKRKGNKKRNNKSKEETDDGEIEEETEEEIEAELKIIRPVTHGICNKCYLSLLYKEEEISKFFREINLPLFLVDSGDVLVEDATDQILKELNWKRSEIYKQLGGNVLRCLHSETPEKVGEKIFVIIEEFNDHGVVDEKELEGFLE